MESLTTPENRQKKGGGLDFISWTTIRYRSVILLAFAALFVAVGVLAYIFPNVSKKAWNAVSSRIASRAAKIGTSNLSRRTSRTLTAR